MSGADNREKVRVKAARTCTKKLRAAADSVATYLHACNALHDGTGSASLRGEGPDGRERMIAELRDYAHFLDQKYGPTS